MTQHTQGPWLIANNGKEGKETETFRIWRNDPDNTEETNRGFACIAPHVHGKANAHLIAAAPDLLIVAKANQFLDDGDFEGLRLIGYAGPDLFLPASNWVTQIQAAAIAKAEGRK